MSSASPSTFQRRPALIPPNLHLSLEDEQSILLRIGNLHLASLGSHPSSSNYDSSYALSSSKLCTGHTQPTVITTYAKSTTPKSGTKRKASTTAEQYQELSCAVEQNLTSKSTQQNHVETRGYSISPTALSGFISGGNHISMPENPLLGVESRTLSPALRDSSRPGC
jgi:hypothetical protein